MCKSSPGMNCSAAGSSDGLLLNPGWHKKAALMWGLKLAVARRVLSVFWSLISRWHLQYAFSVFTSWHIRFKRKMQGNLMMVLADSFGFGASFAVDSENGFCWAVLLQVWTTWWYCHLVCTAISNLTLLNRYSYNMLYSDVAMDGYIQLIGT